MTNKTNADTSSLVIHARRTFFLVLLVCVLAVVVSLYQGGGRIRSAFEQSLTAISMLNYWDTTIKGTEQYLSLSSVIANSVQSPPSNVDAYQLEFTPIENKHMPKVNCIFPFDKTWRFYIGDDGSRTYINGFGEDSMRFDMAMLADQVLSFQRRPKTLDEFAGLWDKLRNNRTAWTIHSAVPTAAAMTQAFNVRPSPDHPTAEGTVVTDFIDYEVTGADPIRIRYDRNTLSQVVALSSMPRGALSQSQRYEDRVHWKYRYPEKILQLWNTQRVETLIVGICTDYSADQPRRRLVTMPVRLNKELYDWPKSWFDNAKQTGFLKPDEEFNPGPFLIAFPDLQWAARGLETVELGQLYNWLSYRLGVEREDSVTLFGVPIPPNVPVLFGVLAILVFQSYFFLHLRETLRRMQISNVGEIGAYQPWIMLYSGFWNRAATVIVVFVPPTVTLFLVYRICGNESIEYWLTLFGWSGVGLSACLSGFAIWVWLDLLAAVRRCRGESNGDNASPTPAEERRRNGETG